MRTWLLTYVVADVCHVCPVHTGPLSDAATLTEEITGLLRRRGIRPEWLIVTGPYAGVRSSGLVLETGDRVVTFGANGG